MSAFICSDRHIATIAKRYADLVDDVEHLSTAAA